jgi:hypothetical protein
LQWRSDRELFFLNAANLLHIVPATFAPTFSAGKSGQAVEKRLFSWRRRSAEEATMCRLMAGDFS